MNTFEGNTFRLLRKVRNFVLFRIHDCVVQQFLNEIIIIIIIIIIYIASAKTIRNKMELTFYNTIILMLVMVVKYGFGMPVGVEFNL